MKLFQEDFNKRCSDVDYYIEVLKFVDNIASNKGVELKGESYSGPEIKHVVTREEQKIMRASFYLIMYNVVESTMNSIITTIIDSINDEHTEMMKLSKQYRELYMNGLFSGISSETKLHEIRRDMVKGIEEHIPIHIEHFKFNTSGNVDYDYVVSTLGCLKCRGNIVHDETKTRNAMTRTKENRNHLAHGDVSYSDCGAGIVLTTIEDDYSHIKNFFTQILQQLSDFIDNKKFLKQP